MSQLDPDFHDDGSPRACKQDASISMLAAATLQFMYDLRQFTDSIPSTRLGLEMAVRRSEAESLGNGLSVRDNGIAVWLRGSSRSFLYPRHSIVRQPKPASVASAGIQLASNRRAALLEHDSNLRIPLIKHKVNENLRAVACKPVGTTNCPMSWTHDVLLCGLAQLSSIGASVWTPHNA